MEKCRRTIDRDGQQSHRLNAKEDAEGLQRAAKQAAEDIGAKSIRGVTGLLKHFGKDQTGEEHRQGRHPASNHSAREWREAR